MERSPLEQETAATRISAEARFRGLLETAPDGIVIADTENHLIRAANLTSRQVTTIAGTGKQAAWGGLGGLARETALSSPWDVQCDGRLLFVAMALDRSL